MTVKTLNFWNVFESSVHSTKRGNVFEKLDHICFVNWTVTENIIFRVFVKSLARKKIETLNFCCSLLSARWAKNLNYAPQNWGTSNQKFSFWKHLFSALFQRKKSYSPLILVCENFCFQRCFDLNQGCSEIFRYLTALKRNWNYSESKLISAERLRVVNPG